MSHPAWKVQSDVLADAVTSEDGVYQYRLTRTWDPSRKHLVWVLLNPGTADADRDDAVIAKCQRFTRRWSGEEGVPVWGGIAVVYLFALRASDPRRIRSHAAPVGVGNDGHILLAHRDQHAAATILAWGNSGELFDRGAHVLGILRAATTQPNRLWHLGKLTKFGHPAMPSTQPDYAIPIPFPWKT